jgi:hypothetical protein
MPALRWSRNPNPYTAGKPDTPQGQLRIWQDPGNHFRVLHLRRNSKTREPSERFLGDADTLDQAKAIAQAHADRGRKKPAAAA